MLFNNDWHKRRCKINTKTGRFDFSLMNEWMDEWMIYILQSPFVLEQLKWVFEHHLASMLHHKFKEVAREQIRSRKMQCLPNSIRDDVMSQLWQFAFFFSLRQESCTALLKVSVFFLASLSPPFASLRTCCSTNAPNKCSYPNKDKSGFLVRLLKEAPLGLTVVSKAGTF